MKWEKVTINCEEGRAEGYNSINIWIFFQPCFKKGKGHGILYCAQYGTDRPSAESHVRLYSLTNSRPVI